MMIIKSQVELPELPDNGSHGCSVELEVEMPYAGVNIEALAVEVQFLYAEDLRIIADHLDKLKNKS